jgi:hypothetical protein
MPPEELFFKRTFTASAQKAEFAASNPNSKMQIQKKRTLRFGGAGSVFMEFSFYGLMMGLSNRDHLLKNMCSGFCKRFS